MIKLLMHICITQPQWLSQVKHICDWVLIGSNNGLLPARCQAITRPNVDLLSIGPLRINFIEILNKIQLVAFKKIDLKISSGTFCLGLNVDTTHHHTMCRLTFPTNTLISIDAVLTVAVLTTRIGGTLIDILQTIYAGESWRTNTLIIPFRVHTRCPISTGLTQRTLILICCAIGARPTLIKETEIYSQNKSIACSKTAVSLASPSWSFELWGWHHPTHCGLVMPYGVEDLGQHWFR